MTADMGPVISAIDEYGDQRYADGATSRQSEVDGLTNTVTALRSQLAAAEAETAAVQAAYDAHMATHQPAPDPTPDPEPEPPAPTPAAKTAYGACPMGGTSTSSVTTKYGSKASVRIFVPGNLARVSRPSTATRVHVSWKPALGSTLTDAQVIEACTGLRDGDIVEVWHESDVKYRKGQDLAEMVALSKQLHERVSALRTAGRIAKVLTCHTWAGWTVDSTSNINPSNLHAPADLLGIDMDGIPASDSFYPYAGRQMSSKFVTAYKQGGYKGWTVPEFCMPSVPSDASRAKRIAWFQSEVAKITQGVPASGIPAPLMIAWFDTSGIIGASEQLTAANEIAAWSALVATN